MPVSTLGMCPDLGTRPITPAQHAPGEGHHTYQYGLIAEPLVKNTCAQRVQPHAMRILIMKACDIGDDRHASLTADSSAACTA